ncbi:MAG: hypothetical protein ABEK16_03300 [Candidatus Nanohalobium sp.]
MEKSWKLRFLEKLGSLSSFLSYGSRERALVGIERAKKGVEMSLRQGYVPVKGFELVEDAEDLFVEKRFEEARECAERALRLLQLDRTRDLDALFHARRLKRSFPEVPEDEVERRHLVLRALSCVTESKQVFTEREVARVFEEGFDDSGAEVLRSELGDLLDSHERVVERDDFAGISLYGFEEGGGS